MNRGRGRPRKPLTWEDRFARVMYESLRCMLRSAEEGRRAYGQTATCHPEREHVGKGLCDACYQRQRYQTVPAVREGKIKSNRASYVRHRDAVMARVKTYYHAHRQDMIKAAVERNRRNPNRRLYQPLPKRPFEGIPLQELARETPVGTPSDKNWWRVADADKPKAWFLGL